MRIIMAVFWPVMLIASIAMTVLSWRKKKSGQADKNYYSVTGWSIFAFISLLGVMMSYMPLQINSLASLLMFAAIVWLIIDYNKKNAAKWWKKSAWLLFGLSVFVCVIGGGATENYGPKTKVIIKESGASRYQSVKKKHSELLSAKKAALLAYAPLAKKVKALEAKEKAEKAAAEKAKREQEEQAKLAKKQAEEARKQSEAAERQATNNDSDSDGSDTSSEASSQRGDMNTADSQKIVGNVNSKIYHVPGQAGYRMNSSNAVYFNSEEEAQRAGYRRAKR